MPITDRGHPAHVLLTIEDYQKLAGNSLSLAEALHSPGAAEMKFTPPKMGWTQTLRTSNPWGPRS